MFLVAEHHNRSLQDQYQVLCEAEPKQRYVGSNAPHGAGLSSCLSHRNRIAFAGRAIFQTLQALEYLHHQGFVCHDLSPRHVLLTDTDDVRLSRYYMYYITDCGSATDFPLA